MQGGRIQEVSRNQRDELVSATGKFVWSQTFALRSPIGSKQVLLPFFYSLPKIVTDDLKSRRTPRPPNYAAIFIERLRDCDLSELSDRVEALTKRAWDFGFI